MNENFKYLVFYDGQCGLCDRMVHFIIKHDKNKKFAFAPLQGETASHLLQRLPAETRFTDSLVLIENFRTGPAYIYIQSKAAFRIAWHLGWPWSLLGLFTLFPSWMFDWAYQLVARNRRSFFKDAPCIIPNQKDRFLP